ncbi:MAG: hypothetical protein H7066_08985 [Cytophagaceae bacterium]|nr:hypothetical protein [Gemmatimonadaceae bacterium]
MQFVAPAQAGAPCRILLFATLSLAAFTSAAAQTGPVLDLSGTWTRVDSVARPVVATTGDASFQHGDAGSGWGSPLTITQRGNKLVVEYQVFSAYDLQPPLQLTFALDGVQSTNTLMVGHAASTLRSTAAWADRALVITTHYPAPAARGARASDVTVRQSLRMDAPGMLVIETTRSGILGAADVTTRTTYARK